MAKVVYSPNVGGNVLFLGERESFPNAGIKNCTHTLPVYAEWESEYLGHGYFCSGCGECLQVG